MNGENETRDDASEFCDALSRLPKREFSPAEKRRIRRQALVARMTEPRRLGAAAASIAVVIAAMSFGLQRSEQNPIKNPITVSDVAATPYATGRYAKKFVLADGSTAWLDWNSTMQVRVSDSNRQVTLRSGRAAFDVVHDVDRPFYVESGTVTTRVTGTEFVVDTRNAGRPTVSVLGGTVDVVADQQVVQLQGGETAEWSDNQLSVSSSANLISNTAWRDGRLVLRNATLVEAFEILEPYSAYDIDVSQLDVVNARISATFFVEGANDAIAGLVQSHNLRINQRDQRLTLSPALPSRPRF
ncbi:MAG: FecR domain-containing protein [Pseudomonadota bacterium]